MLSTAWDINIYMLFLLSEIIRYNTLITSVMQDEKIANSRKNALAIRENSKFWTSNHGIREQVSFMMGLK